MCEHCGSDQLFDDPDIGGTGCRSCGKRMYDENRHPVEVNVSFGGRPSYVKQPQQARGFVVRSDSVGIVK